MQARHAAAKIAKTPAPYLSSCDLEQRTGLHLGGSLRGMRRAVCAAPGGVETHHKVLRVHGQHVGSCCLLALEHVQCLEMLQGCQAGPESIRQMLVVSEHPSVLQKGCPGMLRWLTFAVHPVPVALNFAAGKQHC